MRKTAAIVLRAVLEKKQTLDQALKETPQESSRDRAFVVQLVSTTLRRYGSLISLLNEMMDKPLGDKVSDVRMALLLGMTQVLFMRVDDHAAVNETVNLLTGKRQRYRGLVNAILRRCIRERAEILSHMEASPEENLPHWMASSWSKSYGSETMRAIARSLQQIPKLDLTVKNPADLSGLKSKLNASETATGSLRLDLCDVTALPGYDSGDWWVQDMAAALPAPLLGDITGKTVLDLCAAPGGKTLQLAARGADVIALDRSKNRLARLHDNLARTNLTATVITQDALQYDPAKAPESTLDHILLDAPCSATGTLRRNPDLMWCKDPSDIEKLAHLQSRLLDHAFELLPTGGLLVYCVCSLEAAEGIEQIEAFLDRQPTAKRVPVKASDVSGLQQLITEKGDLLCLPSHLSEAGGMDGFYICRLTK